MAPKYQNQEIVSDESLPVVWELVEHDYLYRQLGTGPVVPLPLDILYDRVLDLLYHLRCNLDPEKSKDEIDLIIVNEMSERNRLGIERYGIPLHPFCDSKPPLVDAYEELQDLAVYLRQHLEEKGS